MHRHTAGILLGALAGLLFSVAARGDMLTAGRAAFEDGLYTLAERYFRRGLTRESDSERKAELAVGIARSLYAQGRYEDQLAWIDGLEPVSPVAASHLTYWAAAGCHALGRHEEALARLENLPRPVLDPEIEKLALRLRSRALYRAGRAGEAIAVSALFDERFPKEEAAAENLLDWAGQLLTAGRTEEATALLGDLYARFPDLSAGREGVLWLGRLLVEEGALEHAERMLSVLAEDQEAAADQRVEAWYMLAAISEHGNNLEEAVERVRTGEELAGQPALRARGALYRARLTTRSGRPAEGLEMLRSWLAEYPDHPQAENAQLEIAELLLQLGRHDEAIGAYQAFLDAFAGGPLTSRAHKGMGQAFLDVDRPLEAAAAFEAAAQLSPVPEARRQALLRSGDALFAAARYLPARERYLEVTRRYPGAHEVPQALFQAAQALAYLDDTEGALRELRAIEDAFPDHFFAAQAALERALWRERTGRWRDAAIAYQRALTLYPQSTLRAAMLQGLGMVRYRLGQFDEALADFHAVGEAAPDTDLAEQAAYMRVWCLYLLDREDEALALCRSFIEHFPESPWAPNALFWLAEYHYNRRMFSEAEKGFAEVAERFAKSPLADNAHYWAGRSAAANKDFLGALEHYERLLTAFPDSPKYAAARFMQGDALSELGRFAAAILAFEDVIQRAPDSYRADLARLRKGDCQFTLGSETPERYREALASYQALRERPDLPPELQWQAGYKAGRCREKMGETEEAFEQYMEVVYDYMARPQAGDGALWFTRAAFHAAAIQEAKGRWSEALRIYGRVASSTVPAAEEARKQMQRIRLEHWFRVN